MKQNTTPRLELLGNILLSRLMNSVRNVLSKCILISNCYFWTDCQVTLSWIKAEEKRFKPLQKTGFVKLEKIQTFQNGYFVIQKATLLIF